MKRGTPVRRLWPVAVTLLAIGLLAALPLLAQGPSRRFFPLVATAADPEVAPQVLRIARVVLRGPAPSYNSDEYVQVTNVSASPADLGGLRLIGGAGLTATRPYVFPAALLPAGASALVFSKRGSDNPGAGLFYINSAGDVWAPGRTAELRDGQGRLLSRLLVSDRPTPTLTPPLPAPGPVEINDIVLRDPAFPNESEEYVQLRNAGDSDVNIGGWRLSNASRPWQVPPFVFPSYVLEVDVTIAVFSAVGEDELDIGDFYWDEPRDVWQVGDRAELRDAQGNLVSTLVVPGQN